MERQFSDLGLAATRVEATTPADIPADDIERYCDPSLVRPLSVVELACTISHTRCWSTEHWTLVLEDDAALSPRLPAFLGEFEEQQPAAVDLVQFRVRQGREVRTLPDVATVAGVRLYPFRSTLLGAQCYLISPRAARHFLAREDLMARVVDRTLFQPIQAPPGVNRVVADPSLARQLSAIQKTMPGAQSDLRPTRIRRKAPDGFAVANFIDHVRNLPKGIRRRTIPFDGALAWVTGRPSP